MTPSSIEVVIRLVVVWAMLLSYVPPVLVSAAPMSQTSENEVTVEATVEPTAEATPAAVPPDAEPTSEPPATEETQPALEPTTEPTDPATVEPTTEPTEQPTTTEPTDPATVEPTTDPTPEPTTEPSLEPTNQPTHQPTTEPTLEPTRQPTLEPTTEVTPTVTLPITPTVVVTAPLTITPTLQLSLQLKPASVQPGELVTVTLTLSNPAQVKLDEIVISTTLPAELTYQQPLGKVTPGFNPIIQLLTWQLSSEMAVQPNQSFGFIGQIRPDSQPTKLNLIAEIVEPTVENSAFTAATLVVAPMATATPETTVAPPGPPAKVQLGLKRKPNDQPDFKQPAARHEHDHWLAVTVTDAEGRAVADGTEVTLTIQGGRLSQDRVRLKNGVATTHLQAPVGQPVLITAQAGSVQAQEQLIDSAASYPAVLNQLKRPDKNYGPEIAAINQARHAVDANFVTEGPGRQVAFKAEGMSYRLTLQADPPQAKNVQRNVEQHLNLDFNLTGLRQGQTKLPINQLQRQRHGNWVTYQASDSQWQLLYEVGAGVVEQYFVFEEPLAESGDLIITGRFQTKLQPVYVSDEAGIRFEVPGQADRPEVALGYGPVWVEDAQGRRLTAQMSLKGKNVQLTIPAAWLAQAKYPIVVDPVIGPAELVTTLQGDANHPEVASNGTDYLMVWDWNGDIYGQRLASNGDPLGDLISISQASGVQERATVVYNPVSDDYLVAWVDQRYGWLYRAAYGQRVATDGSLVGTEFEIAPPAEYLGLNGGLSGTVSANGTYLLVWSQIQPGSNHDVMGQQITANGNLSGSLLEISGAVSNLQRYPAVAYDAQADTYLVVWQDQRDGSEYDLYSQLLTANGSLSGSTQRLVNVSGRDVNSATVAGNDTGQFLVVWEQEMSGSDHDVFAHRVAAATGTLTGSPIDIDTSSDKDVNPVVTALSASEYLVVWEENGYKISAQGVASDGSLTSLRVLDIDRGDHPALATGANEVFAVWAERYTAGQQLIVGQRFSSSAPVGDLVYVSPYYTAREYVDLAASPTAPEAVLIWQQADAAPYPDIMIQRVDLQGQRLGDVLNLTDDATAAQQKPQVAAGQSGYLAVWQDGRNAATTDWDIYGQRLDASGQMSGPVITVAAANQGQYEPAVAYNSQADEYLVAWHDERQVSTSGSDICYQGVTSSGSLTFGQALCLSVPNDQRWVTVAYNPAQNSYLLAWEDDRPGTDKYDIYGQVISADGSLVGSDFAIATAVKNQYEPRVHYNPVGQTYLVVWYDKRNSEWDIYGQVVTGLGALSGSNFALSTASGSEQAYPAVVARHGDSTDEFAVVWQDARNDNDRDIYLQRVSAAGLLLDEADTGADETDPTVNLPIATDTSLDLEHPAITYHPTDQVYLIAWSNLDDGGLYLQRYTSSLPAPPTASFNATSSQGVVPFTAVLTDTSTGQIGQRAWHFGDGGVSYTTGTQVAHTYLTTGTFTVILTTTNPGGSATASQLITVTEQITPSLTEDFEGWEIDDDPLFWRDQANDTTELDQFEVWWLPASSGSGQNRLFGTDHTSGSPVVSSYAIPGWAKWRDYEVSGRMRLTDPAGSVGVMLYSGYPAGEAKWYALRSQAGGSGFELATSETLLTGTLTINETPQADTWYRFRVQVATHSDRVSLQAKVWVEGQAEPGSWQAVADDFSATRPTAGAVGVRSQGAGSKYVDDLVVSPLAGPPQVHADFSAFPLTGPAPLMVQFLNASTGASSYLWNFGDTLTSTLPSPTHTYTAAGVYTVTLTASNGSVSDTLTRPAYITATGVITRDWRELTTTTTVPVIGEQAMAYDSSRDRLVLYGGNATGWPYENTTWEFDGSDWTPISTTTTPQARYGAQTAYLPGQGAFLFGGSDENDTALNQTWVYTNSDWSLVPSTTPVSRTYHALVAVTSPPLGEIEGGLYLFGGNDGDSYFNDLWRYQDGVWLEISTGDAPPARTLAAMTYDPVNERLLLFGGRAEDGTLLADLWALELQTETWTELPTGADAPSARMAHSLTYDPALQVVVLVGGTTETDGALLLDETWYYQEAGWVEAAPITPLSPRAYHQAVYGGDAIILFSDNQTWLYQ